MTKIKQFPDVEKKLNAKMYEEYFDRYHWVDGWDKGSKYNNFESMVKLVDFTGIPISGASCLDVGCGTGDFSLFLRKRGARRYLGIDIYEPSLQQAREQYPHEIFLKSDILQNPIKGKFDYVFCSGALTIKLKTINNYDFLESMVSKMWRLSKVGIVFNVLTTDPLPDPDLFFYSKEKVLQILVAIAPKANIFVKKNEDREQAHFYLWR